MIIKCDCIKEVRIKSCYVGREFVVHHRCDGLSECSVSPFEHFSTMYFNITGEDECQSKDTVGKILVEARWVLKEDLQYILFSSIQLLWV